ncbi:MAG: hypothetical protein JW873_01105 [Candidatus Saganbacteria bacterium]|nr:hypothetical protein [Candidatus Saganbacteria bacterium]
MKKTLAAVLISLFLFNSLALALPFDEQKLMQLKPLLSERLKMAAKQESGAKLWPALIFTGLGLAVLSANSQPSSYAANESSRLSNLMSGSLLLTIAPALYFSKSMSELNLQALDRAGLTGLDREKTAYALYVKSAGDAENSRQFSSKFFTFIGLAYALLPALTPNASDSSKSVATLSGLTLCAMGAASYFFPSQMETDLANINAQLK